MVTINAGDIVTIKPHPAAAMPNDGKPWEVISNKNGALFLRLVDGTPRDTCGALSTAVVTLNGKTL